MNSDYYPPGMSSSEFDRVFGPDAEDSLPDEPCPKCGVVGSLEVAYYRTSVVTYCTAKAGQRPSPEDSGAPPPPPLDRDCDYEREDDPDEDDPDADNSDRRHGL